MFGLGEALLRGNSPMPANPNQLPWRESLPSAFIPLLPERNAQPATAPASLAHHRRRRIPVSDV
jgi:hypothetical protein